ncbi:MAG TPA: formate dehydrogenase [Burkholderiales bacterium]|nr:formate dehydrogenase [Burkholderiales bacterium]
MKPTRTKLSRRNFLLAATAGTAATAAAVIGKQPVEQSSAGAADQPKDKGYQVTEHVQNYYRTARI